MLNRTNQPPLVGGSNGEAFGEGVLDFMIEPESKKNSRTRPLSPQSGERVRVRGLENLNTKIILNYKKFPYKILINKYAYKKQKLILVCIFATHSNPLPASCGERGQTTPHRKPSPHQGLSDGSECFLVS